MEHIEWDQDNYFVQGITVKIPVPAFYQPYAMGYFIDYESVILNQKKIVAPKFFDEIIEKIKKLGWKYYTYKKYPGAVIFLGNK